jgi:two-component system, NarL family, nitrate/nitrite response regulator NarL
MSSAIERRVEPIDKFPQPERLTSRQTQIAMLISEGLSNKEVGQRLNLSEGTIKLHLHNIYTKLRLRNRTALSVFAVQKIPPRL